MNRERIVLGFLGLAALGLSVHASAMGRKRPPSSPGPLLAQATADFARFAGMTGTSQGDPCTISLDLSSPVRANVTEGTVDFLLSQYKDGSIKLANRTVENGVITYSNDFDQNEGNGDRVGCNLLGNVGNFTQHLGHQKNSVIIRGDSIEFRIDYTCGTFNKTPEVYSRVCNGFRPSR